MSITDQLKIKENPKKATVATVQGLREVCNNPKLSLQQKQNSWRNVYTSYGPAGCKGVPYPTSKTQAKLKKVKKKQTRTT